MANTDFNSVLSGSGAINRAALLQALEKRGAYVVEAGENPAALTPGNVTTICYLGVLFWYDSTDALTVHDGLSCIVTTDGKRFKADGLSGAGSRWDAIIDKDLTAPPGSPTLGDKYIVAAAATGAWAAKDKRIAIYTARGWVFIVPKAFDYAYVIDEALIYHYNAAGVWTSGIPASTIADASVSLRKLKYFPLGVAVENQITNAPPGSPADGVAYVVGGAPTGSWAGHSLQLAIFETSAWFFYTPYEGATVYDKALNIQINHDGAVWVPVTSGYSQVSSVFTAASETSANVSSVAFSATVAPTTANSNHQDTVALNYIAKSAGKLLEVEYSCAIRLVQGGAAPTSLYALYGMAGLQIDNTVAMTDWNITSLNPSGYGAADVPTSPNWWAFVTCRFRVTTTDTALHQYKIRHFLNFNVSGGSGVKVEIARRTFKIKELA